MDLGMIKARLFVNAYEGGIVGGDVDVGNEGSIDGNDNADGHGDSDDIGKRKDANTSTIDNGYYKCHPSAVATDIRAVFFADL